MLYILEGDCETLKEEEILLNSIEEKIDLCLEKGRFTSSSFLDIHQRQLAERACSRRKGLRYIFYGGYPDAERTVVVFLPEYAALEDDNPLALLRIIRSGNKELSHGDYLGSLMGLGIKRETIGDILVRGDGADIIVLKKMADFLLFHYEKAGRVNLKAEIMPIEALIIPDERFETRRDTVASLRLDSVVASAFSMSRSSAAEAINNGIVFVNSQLCEKTDRLVKEGDKLVLRGKGKVILETVGNVTRKDRTVIAVKRYL